MSQSWTTPGAAAIISFAETQLKIAFRKGNLSMSFWCFSFDSSTLFENGSVAPCLGARTHQDQDGRVGPQPKRITKEKPQSGLSASSTVAGDQAGKGPSIIKVRYSRVRQTLHSNHEQILQARLHVSWLLTSAPRPINPVFISSKTPILTLLQEKAKA